MQADQLKQRIDRIEECVDEAKRAVQQSASIPDDLRQSVDSLHQQARTAKHSFTGQPAEEEGLRNSVMQMEQAGDRAMQAVRAGGNIDPQTQQAVKRAHDEISSLKKEIQMQ